MDLPHQSQGSPYRLGSVCVIGLGKTGLGLAEYLSRRVGESIDELVIYGGLSATPSQQTDELESQHIHVVLGTETIEGHYNLGIIAPGIPETSGFYKSAQAACDELIGEPEFAWRMSPERWVAITGTNGKTTTTTLTRDLLRAGGLNAREVGNIGTLATSCLDDREEGEWFVAELSSFQLASSSQLHPRIALLLNITEDHVSWHGSFEAYARAKEKVFDNLEASDLAIISIDDEASAAIAEHVRAAGKRVCTLSCTQIPEASQADAAWLESDKLFVRLEGTDHQLVCISDMALQGLHNVQNALAASAIALELGVDHDKLCQALSSFAPLEHRIEPCGLIDGVSYINDSKATNIDATLKALTAFPVRSEILLLGGHDKGADLRIFAQEVARDVKVVVCYGEAGPRFAQELDLACTAEGVEILRAEHMSDALELAAQSAEAGDVVLLSPACSSFDEFDNYEQRGRVFKELVEKRAREA